MSQSKHLGSAHQTLDVPEISTLTNPRSVMGAVWSGDAVEVMRLYICANERLTAPQTGANGANVTAGFFEGILFWDVVKVEKWGVRQAGTIVEGTVIVGNYQVELPAGKNLETVMRNVMDVK